jgi:hypothetical protein
MWSDINIRNTDFALMHVERQRCHMVQRGIGAGPLRPSSETGYCELPASSFLHTMHSRGPLGQYLAKKEL